MFALKAGLITSFSMDAVVAQEVLALLFS